MSDEEFTQAVRGATSILELADLASENSIREVRPDQQAEVLAQALRMASYLLQPHWRQNIDEVLEACGRSEE